MDGSTLLSLGGLMILTAVLLRRTWSHSGREVDSLAEAEAEIRRIEQSARGRLDRWEVHLHDAVRDHEGRLNTAREDLRQLIARAESVADRLENLLPREETAPAPPIRELIRSLREAGYDVQAS